MKAESAQYPIGDHMLIVKWNNGLGRSAEKAARAVLRERGEGVLAEVSDCSAEINERAV